MQIHSPHALPSKESKEHPDSGQETENTLGQTNIGENSVNLEIFGKVSSDSIKNNRMDVKTAKMNDGKRDPTERVSLLAKHEHSAESLKLIEIKLAEIVKANKFTVIDNPDQILNRKTSINKILIAVSVSDTQKILYHVIPICFAPLKGKLRILKQNISYHSFRSEYESEMQKIEVESSIIKNIILDFTNSVKKINDDVSISGKEIRSIAEALHDPINIDILTPANGNKSIAYRYKGIPTTISITPIVVFTGTLDIDMGEKMLVKKIESIGLYISKADTLQWALDYILKKKKKALESPATMAIRKDVEKIDGLRTMIMKIVIASHLIFQLVALPLSVLGIIYSAVYYILFTMLSVASLIGYFKGTASLEKKRPVIRSEKDLFKPEHKKYMDIHLKWMNKGEPVEFKTQMLEEYRLLALYYESLSSKTPNTKPSKNKKSLLQYIDTRDVSKDRIMEQFQALSNKKNGSNTTGLENAIRNRTENTSHSQNAIKNRESASLVMESAMKIDSITDRSSNPAFASEYKSEPLSNFGSDSNASLISASEYESQHISNDLSKSISENSSDSINEIENTHTASYSKESDNHNETEQATEKQISINIESGLISNLQGDLVDSIKEFLNL